MPINCIRNFLNKPSTPGFLLIASGIVALLISNSNLGDLYRELWNFHFTINVFGHSLVETPIFIVNEVLMTIFFLVVGIEIKKEVSHGSLSSTQRALLPGIAAIGGVLFPAIIYWSLNADESTIRGWAIPTATDIAFALGILTILGKRVQESLKIILLAIAIIDDLIAILIIAIFYSDNLLIPALIFAGICASSLIACSYFKVKNIWIYVILGTLLWFSILESGIHATLAGVIIAFCLPLGQAENLDKKLTPWVNFMILPLFAFANAGVNLEGISMDKVFMPVTLGIWLGLFVGKQLGVFSFAFASIKLKIASKPSDINWRQMYGMSILCGIGFTMSIFIAMLSFGENPSLVEHHIASKLGVLIGSTLSAISGYLVLHWFLPKKK